MRTVELQILAGGALTGPLNELAARFEQATGHKLLIRFGTTPELVKLATTGGPFDLGVTPRDVHNDPAARARFVPGPTTDVARVGLGVAVRAGAPRPDIGTPEALKRALLQAASIATIPASAGGAATFRALDLIGISEAVRANSKACAGPAQFVEAVAKGEAELGVFLQNVLIAPGLDLVGSFPAELQQEVVFTAAVSAEAREPEAARAFIAYLTAAEAKALFTARGLHAG
jgi:molybdate transport system substrate-binding protein